MIVSFVFSLCALASGMHTGVPTTGVEGLGPPLFQTEQTGWTTQVADGIVSGPLADPDGDGASNFVEYALGGSALLADAERLRPRVSIVRDGGQTYFAIEHLSVPAAVEVKVNLEYSTDLVTWGAGDLIERETPAILSSGHAVHYLLGVDPIDSAVPAAFVRLRVGQD